MKPSLRATLVGFSLSALFGASCSLLNSFDDVKQGGGGAGGSPSSSSGSPAGGGGAGTGGTTTPSAGGGGSASSGGGMTGSGGTGGAAPVGLIVATGNVGGPLGQRVFSTLDPSDGHELKRYTISAVAVAYDEVTDLWYVFEADNVPAIPSHPMTLHAGRIDAKTGIWTDLHQLANVPVLRDPQSIAVLNHRLVYKAYDPTSDAGFGAPTGLATIDTTNAQPALGGSTGFVAVQDFFGLIGTRANTVDGGVVNLIVREACTTTCQVDRVQVSFPADASQDPGVGSSSPAAVVPPAPNSSSISATWTTRLKGGARDLLAWPPATPATLGTIRPFNPLSAQAFADTTFDASGANQFFAAAVAECEDVLLVTEQQNKAVYAVSLAAGGGVTSATTSTTAPIVAYEPITHTVVVPLHIQGVPISGYTLAVTGTPPVPSLTPRSWLAPADLDADNVTVRRLDDPTSSCP